MCPQAQPALLGILFMQKVGDQAHRSLKLMPLVLNRTCPWTKSDLHAPVFTEPFTYAYQKHCDVRARRVSRRWARGACLASVAAPTLS